MQDMTGGQALAQQLAREGARQIFGLPGVQLDWAVDALIDVGDRIAFTVPRHEQATSYMADGFARSTGEPGLCMVVPGPGLLNAMAGLATAYACSSPVICLVGQIPLPAIGQGLGLLHEVPQQSRLLESVTKWSALARRPDDIPGLVREAYRQVRTGRPQPVAIELPPDVLRARETVSLLDPAATPEPAAPAARVIEQAAGLLAAARFPVIWAGSGVLAAGGSAALAALARRLGAPVVMSENGRGALSDRDPLALSTLGGRAVLPHADVVLVVGSRYVNVRGQVDIAAPKARFIYLNADPRDIGGPRPPGLALVGDARIGLEHLAAALPAGAAQGPGDAACAQVRCWSAAQLARLDPQMGWIGALRDAIPDDGILVNEFTQVGYLAAIAYPVYRPRGLITPGYQGTLGYGFNTGLGVAAGNPDKVVVSINGDGGFGWGLQELATAAKYRLRLITVVFRDDAFGNVRRIQSQTFGRNLGADLHNPDFVALARAFGVDGLRVATPAALTAAIRDAATGDRPILIEVPVGEMPGPWHLLNTISPAPVPAPANPLGEP